jgi:ribosomal protein S18 acetylase RimI-like enzyme
MVSTDSYPFDIRPVTENEMDAILEVYRQCEDFLALGPEPQASVAMVLRDLQTSKEQGGLYCGIYTRDGQIVGVLEYVPHTFKGNPSCAFVELLMIARPFRGKGLGRDVVHWLEGTVCLNPRVTTILTAVQLNNSAALGFWQRNGFAILSEAALQDDGTTTVVLRKEIGK